MEHADFVNDEEFGDKHMCVQFVDYEHGARNDESFNEQFYVFVVHNCLYEVEMI